jgi:energy-coupling factor transporter ATP-binding protein EcfA2
MTAMRAGETSALRVEGLVKIFDVSAPWLNRVVERKPKQFLQAVNDISFDVPLGGCLSLVGESGCGKSTVARLVTGLYKANSGEMRFAPGKDGQPLSAQMIFSGPLRLAEPALAGEEHHRRTAARVEVAQDCWRGHRAGRGIVEDSRPVGFGRRKVSARIFRAGSGSASLSRAP